MSTEVENATDGEQAGVSSYLQAPRKKRKNFVVIAVSDSVDPDLIKQIEGFVRKSYPQLALSRPKSPKDLTRQFSRSISLLVVDDAFEPIEKLMVTVGVLKTKTKKDIAPVLFLTRDPKSLVSAYSKVLAPYQENDDYCEHHKLDPKQVMGRIKFGIDSKNRRRSRRFKFNLKLDMFDLSSNQHFDAKIIDMSLHGALVHCPDIKQFKAGDQMRLSFPVGHVFTKPDEEEFLRVAGRVRRVFIGGDLAGISFEHVTDIQHDKLTRFLVNHAKLEIAR